LSHNTQGWWEVAHWSLGYNKVVTQILDHFDQLAARMEVFMNNQTTTTNQFQAGGCHSEASYQT